MADGPAAGGIRDSGGLLRLSKGQARSVWYHDPVLSPGTTTQPSPPSSWRRAVVAWIMGCALVLGGLTPHAPAEEHADSLRGVEIDGAAQHPRDPSHIEGSRPEVHPACAACLLQIQGSSLLTPLAPLPGLQPGAAVAVQPRPHVSPPVQVPGPARAPPVPSSSR
jgi:hypothetical protein